MKLKGIMPAVITPLKGEQEIDEPALRSHIDYLIDAGVHVIFVLGTNGEFAYLSETEKQQVIEIAADHVKDRVPLLVGISSPSTKIAINLAKHAETVGATAVMAALPTYFILERANIMFHYEKIAESTRLPLYAYNFPLNTRIDLSPKVIAKLAEKKVLAGIKETVLDIDHIKQMIELTPDDFCVICGTELLFKQALALGVDGAILGMGNCFPELIVQMWDAKDQPEKFNPLWERFSTVLKFLNQPIDYLPSLTKEIMIIRGRKVESQVRWPLRQIKNRVKRKLEKIRDI